LPKLFSGVAKEEGNWGKRSWAQALGVHQDTFLAISNKFLSRNLNQNFIFFEKRKNIAALRVITHAYQRVGRKISRRGQRKKDRKQHYL